MPSKAKKKSRVFITFKNLLTLWVLYIRLRKQIFVGKFYLNAGLDIATCGVANASSFYSVATKF